MKMMMQTRLFRNNNSHSHSLTLNAIRNKKSGKAKSYDPSKTFSIRNAFCTQIQKRFSALWKSIYQFVVEEDAFGMSTKKNSPFKINKITGKYAFQKDSKKIILFQKWLEEMSKKNILQYTSANSVGGASGFWTDFYITSAYKKGIERGISEIKNGIKSTPDKKKKFKHETQFKKTFPLSTDLDASISASFFSPVHSDAVSLIYIRTFTELKGITDQMSVKMSSILAQGLAEGRSPFSVAKELKKELDISKNRANTIARTEVIRAHHEATINVYEQYGVDGVKIQAEWQATNDDRVCLKCSTYDGRKYSLDDVRGMIPVHPNCRCVALPVIN